MAVAVAMRAVVRHLEVEAVGMPSFLDRSEVFITTVPLMKPRCPIPPMYLMRPHAGARWAEVSKIGKRVALVELKERETEVASSATEAAIWEQTVTGAVWPLDRVVASWDTPRVT
jgi:hypothetical protein